MSYVSETLSIRARQIRPIGLALGLLLFGGVRGVAEADPRDFQNLFALQGKANIIEEAHCGIANGRITAGTPFKRLGRIEGLWAPPYVSSDFQLVVTISGKEIPAAEFTWWPYKVVQRGSLDGVQSTATTSLIPGRRGGVMALAIENKTAEKRELPLRFSVKGTLDRAEAWEFAAPSSTSPIQLANRESTLVMQHGDLAILVDCPGSGLRWDTATASGTMTVSLNPGRRAEVYLTFAIGPLSEAASASKALAADPAGMIREAEADHLRQVQILFDKLPWLESTNTLLMRFYQRSLVHLLLNRWDVPEFVLHPYYGTGSIKGGCVCDYLWNFGEDWEILPLYDPEATRAHIRQFLKIDLTTHFAFNPLTGQGFGPWYMVNQEKIIGLIYYYVKNTGDEAFLQEVVDGKTVLDHALAHAMFGDNLAQPVTLIDYGPSNSHLELRRGYPYNHVMPDLNGRRYANYLLAGELAELAGKPVPALRQRAEALKTVLKQQLWNPQLRWFDFRDAQGRKDTHYTIQIFKLFASAVLDPDEESGLLSHLNEREFLGEFGLHSLSKTDVAYDQVDIDNGGGGSCTGFPPQIAERLYKAGRGVQADDLLQRIFWWGQRMPYWGDSLVANQLDYRKDTPLQCTIDGASVAQCLIFGLFGVEARFDGSIVIRPHPPAFTPQIALRNLKLRGTQLDISVNPSGFRVKSARSEIQASLGESILVKDNGASLTVLPRP
jgi:hypothetical protein